jgi:hypothetical protein
MSVRATNRTDRHLGNGFIGPFWFDVFALPAETNIYLVSLEKADRWQRCENKLAQVAVGYIQRVANPATMAEAPNF